MMVTLISKFQQTLWASVGALGTLLLTQTLWAQPSGQQAATVVAAPAVQQTVRAMQTSVGTITPRRLATIGSAVSGRVVERPLEEGDRVEANEMLCQLLTETISLELRGAEAELDLREQELAELENGSRPQEIQQAEARMASAAARRDFANSRLARLESLRSTPGAVTKEELDEAVAQAVEAEQTLLEMNAAYELAVEGPRTEVIAQARAQVAIQEALVERLRDQLRKHTVISRFAGYVTATHTEIGQWVNSGDPVAEVVDIDVVDVVAQVVENSVSYVQKGAIVRIEVPAVPDEIFEGTVVAIIPQADTRSRTFPVKVRVENDIGPDGPRLKPGMLARAALPVGDSQQATLVPKDAIVLGGPQPVVVAVDGAQQEGKTGKSRPVPVRLGVAEGKHIQVIGDIKPGQLVVVQGNERLRPDQPVLLSRIDEAYAETASK